MKKLIYTAVIALSSTFCLTSCNFLDAEIYGQPEGNDIYTDESSCMAGLAGVYEVLGSQGLYGLNLWGDLEAGTDIMTYNRAYGIAYQYPCLYSYNNTAEVINTTWKELYTGINRANDFIAQIERLSAEACGGEAKRNMFLAEARALRALHYMNLVAFWGEAPLRTTSTVDLTNQLLKKSPQTELYAQIIQDLTFGAGTVDSEGNVIEEGKCFETDVLNTPGRISRTTAQALLARAYLWQAGWPVQADTWDEARAYAKAVIISGKHELFRASSTDVKYPNGYPSLFINMCSNLYDNTARESMFEVEFYGNGLENSNEAGKVGLYNGITQGVGTDVDVPFAYGWYDATKVLLRLYNKKYTNDRDIMDDKDGSHVDARKWWACADYKWDKSSDGKKAVKNVFDAKTKLNKMNGETCPGKWRAEYDPIRPWARNNSSINFPIMRYSDVLLMFAEADNELNGPTQEAIDAINEVRGRAGTDLVELSGKGDFNTDYAKDVIDMSTTEGLRQFIFEERTRELCFEVPRHQELRRMGKEVFFNRIRMLKDQDLNNSADKKPIGYGLDNIHSIAAQQVADKHIYLPIPQCELNTNTICGQNEGW